MDWNLVVQGARVADSHIEDLQRLSGAAEVNRLAPGAVRLNGARRHVQVARYCDDRRLDFAFVPPESRLADFRLLAMDMDSTLITIECIDELADLHGVKRQVSEITRSAMRGELDFAESLRRRVALLKGLDQSALEKVYDDRLLLSHGAERMLERVKALGIRTLLVSGGFTFFTERLQTRLGLDYAFSNQLEISEGRLTGRAPGAILDAQGKADKLREVRERLALAPERVIAIGDGANDLEMMSEAGVSLAYRAKPLVQRYATYCINHVGLDGLLHLFP